jgi:hypothetical protein
LLIGETHLAMTGVVGASCQKGKEMSKVEAVRTFHEPVLTVFECVSLTWRAT